MLQAAIARKPSIPGRREPKEGRTPRPLGDAEVFVSRVTNRE
jgi:hypothetical protein